MDFTVPMALVDFIPVICWTVAAVLLQRDLYQLMPKGAYSLMACGQIDVACAGGLKALYKLMYAAGWCDFTLFNTLFFPLQAIGFIFAGLGVLGFLQSKRGRFEGVTTRCSAILSGSLLLLTGVTAPPVVKGTMLFVVIMVLGMALVCFGLCYFAFKVNIRPAGILFVLCFLFSVCMGYLSSRDFADARMNWIAEAVNICGQGSLLAGTLMIHKAVKENK